MKPLFKSILSWPLRFHLIMMLLLLALPTLALILYFGFDLRKKALHDEIWETRRLVNSIVTEQYNLTGDAWQLMNVLALMPIVQQKNKPEVEALLASILNDNRMYSNIVICDREGDVWASAIHANRRVSLNNEAVFRKVMAAGRFSSGEYAPGSISVKSVFGFGYPVVDARGNIASVIIVKLDFDFLNEMLMQSGLPGGFQFVLADCNGTIVYMNPKSGALLGTRLNEQDFQRIVQHYGADVSDNRETIQRNKLTSYGRLQLKWEESPYLYVVASIPLKESLGWADRTMFVQFALLCVCLFAVLILVTIMGKVMLVDQINALRFASERLAQGDRGVSVSDSAMNRELGELARSFNDMARQLTSRESELNELNASLSHKVTEETERRMAHERVMARHARLAAIGEMIGAIAHQWRQPLTTLGATIQSIKIAWEQNLLDRAYLTQTADNAKRQIEYMSNTIEDFRNFFNSDKVAGLFNVREKIDEVIQLVSAQFMNSGIGLELSDVSCGAELTIHGYQNEFKQSVLNLVSNSFDAVLAKHGTWGSSFSSAGVVRVKLDRSLDKVVIEIIDNGCGIPADYADRIFEPYFTTKLGGKGTGIGLYMTRLIVEESMGGRITFSSSAEGTLFRIEIASGDLSTGEMNV